MQIRHPVVAGMFYEASASACRRSLEEYIPRQVETQDLPENIVAGIVPHAGWTYSGAVAGKVFAAIARQWRSGDQSTGGPEVFVLFGAMHRGLARLGGVFSHGAWRTPLGDAPIDDRLAERILSSSDLLAPDAQVHADEHSLEVVVPFIQYLFPQARILPIAVPPLAQAHQIGRAVGRVLAADDTPAVCLGSTDLTHYGPGYGFTPQGPGRAGITWASQVNDQAIIDLICRLQDDKIVAHAQAHSNACGAGAVAATVAAARQMGAQKAVVLEQTCSADISRKLWGQEAGESVGYAGIVLG